MINTAFKNDFFFKYADFDFENNYILHHSLMEIENFEYNFDVVFLCK